MDGPTCPMVKPGKASARPCAIALLTKVMFRELKPGEETDNEISYTPEEIENAVYDAYPSRDTYLSKIAKIALHLSLHTRTGRVSWTFHNRIFNRGASSLEGRLNKNTSTRSTDDYLEWLLTTASNEDVFPELYSSFGYLDEIDRKNFEQQMHLEHASILTGLQEIVRQCCDSGVCTLSEMNTKYDTELFKAGSVFETAAQSVCSVRKVMSWIPPGNKIFIPSTAPVNKSGTNLLKGNLKGKDTVITPKSAIATDTPEPYWKSLIAEGPPLSALEFEELSEIEKNRVLSSYQSQDSDRDIHRDFDVSGQITCFDVSNLIHNLATLPLGKLLELPWDGSLLEGNVQQQLYDKFKVEIAMRRYFLDNYYGNQ